MRRQHITAVVVLAIVLGGLAYWQFGRSKQGPGGPMAMPPSPVEVVEVAPGAIASITTAVGTLRSNETLVVRPEVAGRIAKIHFEEGAPVAKGTPLFSLDDSVARAELAQERAKLKLAEVNFKRADELANRGWATARSRDEALSSLELGRASVALMEARMAKMVIRAPFAGMAGLRLVTFGDYVNPGQDLVNLESFDPMKVDFRVPEIYLAQVREGQPIDVAIEALGGMRVRGKVLAIDPLIDQSGRSIVIRAVLPNDKKRLRPGAFGRVDLVLEQQADALLVPETAVFPVGDKQFVYVVADGKAARREVAVGLRHEGKVQIRQGLSAGDKVVTAGQMRLYDGAPVAVAASAGAS
jgi:membrane fusion protein, multidrug efflux system